MYFVCHSSSTPDYTNKIRLRGLKICLILDFAKAEFVCLEAISIAESLFQQNLNPKIPR
jgi:hypothetical protein